MSLDLSNTDLETFSKYLGLTGLDVDLFYETYYQLDSDSLEIEDYWIESEET